MGLLMPHPLPQLEAPPPPTAPASTRKQQSLRDSHGRAIHDLRLSITDRCNFRCRYCMEPDDRFLPKRSLLSTDEYMRIVDAAISVGIRKVRITGGEPTLCPDLDLIVRELGKRDLDDLAMTTNGWRLDVSTVNRWREDGLTRLTFSLDTLREDRFATITRSSSSVFDVIHSIENAIMGGLPQPKVNVVALRHFNEDEFADFADLARDLDIDVRFIEYMPLDSGRAWTRDRVVAEQDILASISARHRLEEVSLSNRHSTSRSYRFADGAPGRIGIIAPVTRPFCGACNRLRITAEGAVRPCLFSNREWDLRPLLRHNATTDDLAQFLVDAVWTKQAGHGIGLEGFQQPERGMSAIGG